MKFLIVQTIRGEKKKQYDELIHEVEKLSHACVTSKCFCTKEPFQESHSLSMEGLRT